MNSKLTLALLSIFMLVGSFSYASFPVERETIVSVNAETSIEESTTVLSSPAAVAWSENQTIAILLWFFLGGFAGHRWFLKSPWYWNVLFILTIGFFVVGWVIDGIEIITGTYPGL
ncbi:TM2 domain-containing protein [Nonlabens agnitus]|uniref:S-adenosyl-L-homocysteine hydrolase n=1 Tax=Nonlabens agnitus TaxID=870484 RepID=A0A2S9WUF8_9FLAO|nr:TM2 domain-containing protein [Nonlabens agnitus]PRP67089.1 S-adenosyl-L-homocysteine hydrolase [Nonlabens agnitus]